MHQDSWQAMGDCFLQCFIGKPVLNFGVDSVALLMPLIVVWMLVLLQKVFPLHTSGGIFSGGEVETAQL